MPSPPIGPADLLAALAEALEDVRGILLERFAKLDLASIRSTLRMLEEALSRSDLRPSFEAELARVRPSVGICDVPL